MKPGIKTPSGCFIHSFNLALILQRVILVKLTGLFLNVDVHLNVFVMTNIARGGAFQLRLIDLLSK